MVTNKKRLLAGINRAIRDNKAQQKRSVPVMERNNNREQADSTTTFEKIMGVISSVGSLIKEFTFVLLVMVSIRIGVLTNTESILTFSILAILVIIGSLWRFVMFERGIYESKKH